MPAFTSLSPKELSTGIVGYYAHGKLSTLGYVEIKAGSVLGKHHHPHEQITFIAEGQLDMTIGDQNVSLTKGMFFVIPSNTPHSAIAVTDCVVIDSFSPVREDYR